MLAADELSSREDAGFEADASELAVEEACTVLGETVLGLSEAGSAEDEDADTVLDETPLWLSDLGRDEEVGASTVLGKNVLELGDSSSSSSSSSLPEMVLDETAVGLSDWGSDEDEEGDTVLNKTPLWLSDDSGSDEDEPGVAAGKATLLVEEATPVDSPGVEELADGEDDNRDVEGVDVTGVALETSDEDELGIASGEDGLIVE